MTTLISKQKLEDIYINNSTKDAIRILDLHSASNLYRYLKLCNIRTKRRFEVKRLIITDL